MAVPLATPAREDVETAVLPTATVSPIIGIAVLGGSSGDEYRADDNRGAEYGETTLNWVEQLVRYRNLNFGEWGSWGEPRRTGYEYNWARSRATMADIIAMGQHTGVAQLVAEGRVSQVVIFNGGNDLHPTNGTYAEIYDGSMDENALRAKIDKYVADMTTAVTTILEAGDVQMVVVSMADPGVVPGIQALFPDAQKRQRVTTAVAHINAGIAEVTTAHNIPLVDMNAVLIDVFSQVDANGELDFGDEKITFAQMGDEPHHMQLQDQSGHPGTVFSGLIANAIFVEPFNKGYGLDIIPLQVDEILKNAGLR
jgi:lysophospholipase L1-like esterase